MVERVAEVWRPLRKIAYTDQVRANDYKLDDGTFRESATLSYSDTVVNGTVRALRVVVDLRTTIGGTLAGNGLTLGLDNSGPVSMAPGQSISFSLHSQLPRGAAMGNVAAQVRVTDVDTGEVYTSLTKTWVNASQGSVTLSGSGGFGLV